MSFQDNSGDIIFDVVLTDEGRRRMARGDGSFTITQFALSDDEINYELFDAEADTASQDLEILQTPVFEAFTNNMSSMNSRLITLSRNDILYLPILKLNELRSENSMHDNGSFVVAVDGNTEDNNNASDPTNAIGLTTSGPRKGVIYGQTTSERSTSIRIDTGLDTSEIPPAAGLSADLQETAFMVQIDNRLGSIVSEDGTVFKNFDYVDDDDVAVYTFQADLRQDQNFIVDNNRTENSAAFQTISGPTGKSLIFKVASSNDLRQSNFLFTQLGSTTSMTGYNASTVSGVKFIDTVIKVTGMNLGYSISIPVRFVKQ